MSGRLGERLTDTYNVPSLNPGSVKSVLLPSPKSQTDILRLKSQHCTYVEKRKDVLIIIGEKPGLRLFSYLLVLSFTGEQLSQKAANGIIEHRPH
jgi:hypothetical protein